MLRDGAFKGSLLRRISPFQRVCVRLNTSPASTGSGRFRRTTRKNAETGN